MIKKNRFIAGCGMLIATAVILQYMDIAVGFMPSFIKLDISDLPELIGAYAYGPLAGIVISVLKNMIHMTVSQSGFAGELSNALLGCIFSGVAGVYYKVHKTKKGALIGGILGAVIMGISSYPINLFVIYPMYYGILNYPEEVILNMYQVILPSIRSIGEALLIFNLPFTLCKGLINVFLSQLIYKRLSYVLKGKH